MSFPRPFNPWRPHPWHGVAVGPDPPEVVHAYIEITPFDVIKYEVDKTTGFLKVDRPQRSSSLPPSLYGLIPRTYCGKRVGALSPRVKGGDGDPMDICVISERPINRSEILLNARVIGGLQVIDHREADDKIIAVLANDRIWTEVQDLTHLPSVLVERLIHYFSTYKVIPGQKNSIHVENAYGRSHALKVVEASMLDYEEEASR